MTTTNPVFENYAHYYDLLYADKNYEKETDYVLNLAKRYSQTISDKMRILELGCGTGGHAVHLAKRGFQITAVDASSMMLEMAERKSSHQKNLQFFKQDIRKLNFLNHAQFDMVFSLFHVMSYLNTNEDWAETLKSIHRYLKPGALFIFDVWYGPAVLAEKPSHREKTLENDKIKILRKASPTLHLQKNRVDVHYDVLIENKKDLQKTNLQETHSMRFLFLPEIEELLNEAGFELLTSEEWLTGNKPSESTWGVAFVAKKTI